MTNNGKKALVYHSGALGDFITTVPAIDYWKRQHKNFKVILLGDPLIGRFATEAAIVHGFMDINQSRHAALFSDKFRREISDFLAPFSYVIAFAGPDSPFVANLHVSNIPYASQPPFPRDRTHAVDYHLSFFCDGPKLSKEDKIPRIALPIDALAEHGACIPMETGCCAIHPGSGSVKKNWPFERFLAVARGMREKGRSIIWIAGPAEQGLVFPTSDYLFVNQPLLALGALLCRCGLYIGNDNGVTHLAAALGCRTIALFGPSDPAVWAPRGTNVKVLYKSKPCSPCRPDNLQTCTHDRSCLSDIGVNDVLAACGTPT